ncbi:MAG: hypothetical protein PUC82_04420 [bacterium]|nr:hypothetical protein [bacterium]
MNDEKKKDLKFIIIFILVLTISLTYLTQSSLARYRKQTNVQINTNIAKWNIVVNKEDITNKNILTNQISPIFDENEFIKEGFIAPGATGYCDIVIDAKDVDVDFNYTLVASIPSTSSIKDLKVTEYTIDPTNNSDKITYNEETPITGSIEKNSRNNIIRLYLIWEEENGEMNNQEDTKVATDENSKALININLKFEQKIN